MDPKEKNDNLPSHIEYVEAEPIEPSGETEYYNRGFGDAERKFGEPQTVFVQTSNGTSCCGGCGCLGFALLLLFLYNGGAVLSGIIIVVATLFATTWLMRLSGISPRVQGYGFLVAPVFLMVLNLMAKLIQGAYIFTFGQYIAISLVTMVVLYGISAVLKQRLKF